MKVYLLDINPRVVDAWNQQFEDNSDVKVVCDDFACFMEKYNPQAVVSPGNSRGVMAGGYDRAISEYFGWALTEKVQKFIVENFNGAQPVGSSQIFDIDGFNNKLIHTPTMLFPSKIDDYNILFSCTKTCLDVALKNNIESIVIPAFGGACGQVSPKVLAEQMYKAYIQWKAKNDC